MKLHQEKLARQAKIRELRAQGKTADQIQKILGVSQWAITDALRFVDPDKEN